MRAWLLFHQPTSSDEANAGMLATGILHGHFQAFYPGQVYGGAEPYVLAGVIAIVGHSGFALHLESMLLSAVASILVWRIALRLVRSRKVAALAGALAWVAPVVNVMSSSIYQGRGVTLACGLLGILMALRILDTPEDFERARGYVDFSVLGLAAGVGWWSLPEIVYFYPSAALLVIGALVKARASWTPSRLLLRVTALIAAFILGELPWLWSNLNSHFASLKTTSFSGGSGSASAEWATHLHLFMLYVLPMQLGLRKYGSGAWITTSHLVAWIVAVVIFAVLALSVVLSAWKRGRVVAIALGALAFPLLYSQNPGTWFWQDGRYAVYLGPLIALLVAIGCDEAGFRLRRVARAATLPIGEVLLGLVVVVGLVLSFVGFHDATGVSVTSYGRGWGNPDAAAMRAIHQMEQQKIFYGYADYWVAFDLDYLSGGRLVIASSGIGDDIERWPGIDAVVRAARKPAWIFVLPAPPSAFPPFPVVGGPNLESETVFLAGLKAARIRFHVFGDGIFDVVTARQRVLPRLYPGPLSIGG